MVWNSTWPVGGVSVKSNRITGNQNTTYIETTMGNDPIGTNNNLVRDHFWDVGSNEDGRHRFINSPGFTVGGNPADPDIGAGMDGVLYLKSDELNPENILGFYKNSSGVIQYIPMQLKGIVSIPSSSSYTDIVNVPDNSYGDIFMYNTNSDILTFTAQKAFYKARGGVCQSYSLEFGTSAAGFDGLSLLFANGTAASGLSIRARRRAASASLTDWNYIVRYWKLV